MPIVYTSTRVSDIRRVFPASLYVHRRHRPSPHARTRARRDQWNVIGRHTGCDVTHVLRDLQRRHSHIDTSASRRAVLHADRQDCGSKHAADGGNTNAAERQSS